MNTESFSKQLTLFHYWRSSASWRVRWALNIKKVEANLIPVNLLNGESDSPEHLARSPFGYVPVLQVGEKKLIESVAIIEWLEEMIPTPQLYPGDAYEKAFIRSLVEVVNSGTSPIQNSPVVEKFSNDPDKQKEWIQYFIRRGLLVYEKMISSTAGKYSIGDQVTAADLFLIPQFYNAIRWESDLTGLNHTKKIYEYALVNSGAKETAPEFFKPL